MFSNKKKKQKEDEKLKEQKLSEKENINEETETLENSDNEELNNEMNEAENLEQEEEILDQKKDEEIKKLEQQLVEEKEKFLRKVAEFENYKRRTEIETMNLLKYAAEGFILNIIPVFDDLNRSLNHIETTPNVESLKQGLNMVRDKFQKTLDEQGIKKIESKGKEFDVNLHEALMQQPSGDVEPDTVLDEVEPGYMYKDKVIKHAKVIVSTSLPEAEATENNVENDDKE
ncbi:MAG: nucleotide exchange factor GrpE [Melioribacteraceae bacterium]|nr:nucleotide exchange factor GrpE [Melioribacteraceae bacterium]MCF8263268.1 nucleotide exchange factor GrpE [Melioribacteraceae bacterium]MCF8412861.1 nucleotide exchange factor GrpE [Melioribacteraceae bacterium]MCF8430708.1 nucleotide exchange factor GrpE [Melioribacteraceae bacterium]